MVRHPVYHAWAEYYLKGYGWMPVETQSGTKVPNQYAKLFVGKDIADIDVRLEEIHAYYQIIK